MKTTKIFKIDDYSMYRSNNIINFVRKENLAELNIKEKLMTYYLELYTRELKRKALCLLEKNEQFNLKFAQYVSNNLFILEVKNEN